MSRTAPARSGPRPAARPRPRADLDLRHFLPYQLSVLSNTISGRIAELYDREFGLSIQEWRVMTVVADAPGINAKEIGRRTAMDKVAVSRAITSLLTSRRLERRTHDEDRRHSELYLTAAGEAVYRRIVPMALAEEARLLKTLSASEREQLNVLLSKLARAAEPSRDLW